jgi:hypothetical protein
MVGIRFVKANKNGFSPGNKINRTNHPRRGGMFMETIMDYFKANPAAFTLLSLAVVIVVLYSILQKMIKLAIVVVFLVLISGGVYFFKDPGTIPDKIKTSVETFKNGSEAISDKFSNLWSDMKDLGGKMKKVPGDLNKMLDTSKEQAGK